MPGIDALNWIHDGILDWIVENGQRIQHSLLFLLCVLTETEIPWKKKMNK